MADGSDYAPLTAALVRRSPAPAWIDAAEDEAVADAAVSAWYADLRLFAITWAAGFVFFLTFIA